MFWHYFKEVVGIVVIVHGLHGLLNFCHSAKAGEFRRIWNWPMRIAVVFWLAAGVFGYLGAWVGKQPGGSVISNGLGNLAIFAAMAGLVSLVVFVAGFLLTMIRDFQPQNRPALAEDDIDQVQRLLLEGQKVEAIGLYQKQNNVNATEAEEAIEAVDSALQAGLRV